MIAIIVSWAVCYLVHLSRCIWKWHKLTGSQQPPDVEMVAPSEVSVNGDIVEDDIDDGDSFVTCPGDYYDTCEYIDKI